MLAHRTILSICLVALAIQNVRCQPSGDTLFTYCWTWSHGDTIATIQLPRGFQLSKEDEYGEGKITALVWSDSSVVLLHFGGDVHTPLLRADDFVVQDSSFSQGRLTRRGTVADTYFFWREDELGIYHIAYFGVRRDRVKVFDTSLTSFSPHNASKSQSGKVQGSK